MLLSHSLCVRIPGAIQLGPGLKTLMRRPSRCWLRLWSHLKFWLGKDSLSSLLRLWVWLTQVVVSRSQSSTVSWTEASLSSLPCGSLHRTTLNWWLTLLQWENEQARKWEPDGSHSALWPNLVNDILAIFHPLDTGHWVMPTLKVKAFHRIWIPRDGHQQQPF